MHCVLAKKLLGEMDAILEDYPQNDSLFVCLLFWARQNTCWPIYQKAGQSASDDCFPDIPAISPKKQGKHRCLTSSRRMLDAFLLLAAWPQNAYAV